MDARFTADMFIPKGQARTIPPQVIPVRSGARSCDGCGKTISANKRKCWSCFEAENKARQSQGS